MVDDSVQEGIADEDVDDEKKDAVEEQSNLKFPNIPVKPDEAEVEKHRKTHWPYRSWCDCCNEGRGLGEQRGRGKGGPHDIPVIGIDYYFITTDGIKARKELEYAESVEGEANLEENRKEGMITKCIIIRDFMTKCIFSHVIPCKGADGDKYAVKCVVSSISWLGHARIILKSDGEPAILSLVKHAVKSLRLPSRVSRGEPRTKPS